VGRDADVSQLPQVRSALSGGAAQRSQEGTDIQGRAVFSTFATVPGHNWFVFFEMLTEEAYAPFRASIAWSGALLISGVVLVLLSTLFLSRRRKQGVSALITSP
jgi:hypothetical protein